jgi:hypothetical protein
MVQDPTDSPDAVPSPPLPEVVCGGDDGPQAPLPLASAGVQRYVWQMAHGPILIEIRDGGVYVNGDRVEPIAETLQLGSDIP